MGECFFFLLTEKIKANWSITEKTPKSLRIQGFSQSMKWQIPLPRLITHDTISSWDGEQAGAHPKHEFGLMNNQKAGKDNTGLIFHWLSWWLWLSSYAVVQKKTWQLTLCFTSCWSLTEPSATCNSTKWAFCGVALGEDDGVGGGGKQVVWAESRRKVSSLQTVLSSVMHTRIQLGHLQGHRVNPLPCVEFMSNPSFLQNHVEWKSLCNRENPRCYVTETLQGWV